MRISPIKLQENWFHKLIQASKQTAYGKKYGFKSIKTYQQFADQVPIVDYDDMKPYIQQMMKGKKDILWPGYVRWYSKSSGTTADRSKYIPVTSQNLRQCHIQGSWDSMSILYHHKPQAKAFEKKSLIMGGSLSRYDAYPKTRMGDVSAIMLYNMPFVGRPFYTPDFETALLDDWEEKIERMSNITIDEDLVMMGGVPTWSMVLMDRILEKTGKENMLEIWPNVMAYLHGGVAFEPYREQFKKYFPSDDFLYQEIYNASEGFIGIQDNQLLRNMLLLSDNGMFFEFESLADGSVVPLEGIKKDVHYALLLSSNSGLWRYRIGDTVIFDSVLPPRFKITGRTQQFINVFGEEVMVSNTDQALAKSCKKFGVVSNDYTVAPIFLESNDKGGHEWVVEFEKNPSDLEAFRMTLDQELRNINSDYDAKRSYNLALDPLLMHAVPKGTFNQWMKERGKLGGQNKVPRLNNKRKFIDSLLEFISIKTGKN